MPKDIRNTHDRGGPVTGSGSGAAYRTGYGPGGLGAGADRTHQGDDARKPGSWDAPGVTPAGRRTGASTDGPRIATDGEGEPQPGKSDRKSAGPPA